MPSVQTLSTVALLVGSSAFASPLLGARGDGLVHTVLGGNDWNNDHKCLNIKQVYDELKAIKNDDWSRCPQEINHDQWKEHLVSCIHEKLEWNGDNHKCLDISFIREELEAIKNNDWSRCPKERSHDEWREYLESCIHDNSEWNNNHHHEKCFEVKDLREELRFIKNEDWSRCPKEQSHDEWKEYLEFCIRERKWNDDEDKCLNIKDVYEELKAIKNEDWSRCLKEESHDEWKEHVESCIREKEWKHDDEECKDDVDEWKHDDQEWNGDEDKEEKHDEDEDDDEEWKGEDDDEEWKGEDDGEDDEEWKGFPEHSCIPSKHLPKNRKISVEEWLHTITESSVIYKKEQFETLLD